MFASVTPSYSHRYSHGTALYSAPNDRGGAKKSPARGETTGETTPTIPAATGKKAPEKGPGRKKGPRKRGNNLGSIYRDGDGWRVALPTGETDAAGRPKLARKRFEREADARAYYSRAMAERERGTLRAASGKTLAAYLREWLEHNVDATLAPKTAESYRRTVESFILPALGSKKLEAVTHDDVQRMVNALAKTRKKPLRAAKEGEEPPVLPFLSRRQVEMARDVLRAALGHARDRARLIGHNPAEGVTIPKTARRPPERESLTRAQIGRLLAAVEGTADEPLITFLLGTGARIGEALGLRWSDVELRGNGGGGSVTFRGQLQYRPGNGLVWSEGTKTGSRAPLSVPEPVAAALRGLRGARLVDGMDDAGLVFLNDAGKRTDPSLVNRRLKRHCKNAGVPPIGVHVLRHTALTVALEATGDLQGVSKAMAGHSTTRLLADRYAHVLEGRDRDRAEKLGRAMFGGEIPTAGRDFGA